MEIVRAANASAGGSFLSTGTAPGYLAGASLRAAAANATATIRDGTAGGAIIAVLAAPANGTDHFAPLGPVFYTGAVHVTVTGAGAEIIVYGA
jgi:hypothetical protein